MNHFKAGAGKSDIIFAQEMFPIEGFLGVHDNPCARILVLDNEIRIALVSLDLVMISEELIQELKDIVAERTGAPKEHIWIHVTHSTSTPHPPRMFRPKSDNPKEEERELRQKELFCQALTDAVRDAAGQAARLTDASLGAGTADCDINVNRDVPTPYGWWIGTNEKEPSNKKMTVIRVDDRNHNMIGLLLNYGVKPCTIDQAGRNDAKRLVSADVTGFACRMTEDAFHVPVLFFMGASADQVTKEQAWYEICQEDGSITGVDLGVETGISLTEKYGTLMGEAAIAAAQRIPCGDSPKITHKKTSFRWKTRERIRLYPRTEFTYQADGREAELPVEVIGLGDIALVGEKPEVCCATELALKEASPFPHTLLTVMVNGGMKYMPNQISYDRITWEAMNSALMPGCAETFLEVAEKLLLEVKEETV